jgi:hypothetical protein
MFRSDYDADNDDDAIRYDNSKAHNRRRKFEWSFTAAKRERVVRWWQYNAIVIAPIRRHFLASSVRRFVPVACIRKHSSVFD